MKKFKNLWLRIPRWVRACLNLIAVFLLAVTFYVCIGAPTLTEAQAFRRAEKANLVGPSTILVDTDLANYDYDHLILAETDVCVLTYVTDKTWYSELNYIPKTGDITVVAAPKGPFNWGYQNLGVTLPVFVVDDVPAAQRAELEIHILGTYVINLNGEQLEIPLDHRYSLESQREAEGFFRFVIELPFLYPTDAYGNDIAAEHGADGYALDLLAEIFTDSYYYRSGSSASITAAVRLYDISDNLMETRELTLREPNETSEGGENNEN